MGNLWIRRTCKAPHHGLGVLKLKREKTKKRKTNGISVLWFNLGMHHAPHTGDLPNTVFTTAHSALIIEPLNYLEMDASRATSQQVRLNYKDGKVQSIKTFGSQNMTCHVDAVRRFRPWFWSYR